MKNVTSRFVVFDDGVESDWIDPVLEVNESEESWFVNNGFNTYEIPKIYGRTVTIQ